MDRDVGPSGSETGVETEVLAETETRDEIDRLVVEIERAIALIERLRRDNGKLSRRCEELQTQLEKSAWESSIVRTERDELKTVCEENASLIRNKHEIELKIEAMLSRLDDVNLDTT
jgi:predicted RNase H-like nuclease (RuvC/YqgF family)